MSALDTKFKSSKRASQPQFTKGWAVTEEMIASLQLLLIATYPAIVRLGSVPDPRQRPKLAVLRDKTDNLLKLVLSKPSSQPVLILSTAGHRHLETQQLDPFPQSLCSSPSEPSIEKAVEVAAPSEN